MSQVSAPYAPGATPVWTSYTYDARGRTLTLTAPDGVSVTRYAYQGNQTTVTDPAGKSKTYTSDANGNLTQVSEPNPAGGTLVTLYTYDSLNHLTRVSMTRGSATQVRTFTYDPTTQRLSSATTPESGTVQFTYNADGTLLWKIDAKGQKTQYGYDTHGRVTSVNYAPDGVTQDVCQRVTYTYDFGGAPEWGTAVNALGKVTSKSWGQASGCMAFVEDYAYTASGGAFRQRLKATLNSSVLPLYLENDYDYDGEGRVNSMDSPSPTTTVPTSHIRFYQDRDALARPVDVYVGSASVPQYLITGATYNAAGQLLQMTAPGYTETRQYNTNLQLTRITAGNGTPAMDLSYNYPAANNNGRIQSMVDNVSGEQVTYAYDQLNRLIQSSSTGTGVMNYAYDGFGNLTQMGATAMTVDPLTNRMTSAGYLYDVNGNVTQTPDAQKYGYDVANRLTSRGAIYDPQNRRVWDGLYLYLYSVSGQFVGKYQPVWRISLFSYATGYPNTYFNGRLVLEAGVPVMTDRLGSVRVSGEVSNYLPYGTETTATSNQRTKFGTYTRDTATVDYADQRYYFNTNGRFLTPDPSRGVDPADPGSWNKYAYVGGDPVNFNDPAETNAAMVQSGYPCGPNWMWDASLSGPCDGGGGGGGGEGGGGGGGWWCGGNYFDPSPNPLCYAPIAVPPPEPPSAKPIECMATLFDRPVDDPRAQLVGATHSYWQIQIFDPNSGAKLVDKVISGGPNNVVDPSTGKTTTYLDVWVHSIIFRCRSAVRGLLVVHNRHEPVQLRRS